jgi:hypothetical protein
MAAGISESVLGSGATAPGVSMHLMKKAILWLAVALFSFGVLSFAWKDTWLIPDNLHLAMIGGGWLGFLVGSVCAYRAYTAYLSSHKSN